MLCHQDLCDQGEPLACYTGLSFVPSLLYQEVKERFRGVFGSMIDRDDDKPKAWRVGVKCRDGSTFYFRKLRDGSEEYEKRLILREIRDFYEEARDEAAFAPPESNAAAAVDYDSSSSSNSGEDIDLWAPLEGEKKEEEEEAQTTNTSDLLDDDDSIMVERRKAAAEEAERKSQASNGEEEQLQQQQEEENEIVVEEYEDDSARFQTKAERYNIHVPRTPLAYAQLLFWSTVAEEYHDEASANAQPHSQEQEEEGNSLVPVEEEAHGVAHEEAHGEEEEKQLGSQAQPDETTIHDSSRALEVEEPVPIAGDPNGEEKIQVADEDEGNSVGNTEPGPNNM